jgi:hypothetical protein
MNDAHLYVRIKIDGHTFAQYRAETGSPYSDAELQVIYNNILTV